jgi:hypothetical protein
MGDIKIPEGSSLRAAFDAWWAEDHHWGGSLQAACVTAFKAGVAAERAAPAPVAPAEFEVRDDGERVRVDRWEVGIRRIVALLWGNRHAFEVDEVVEAVRALVPAPNDDDEGLVRAVLAAPAPVAHGITDDDIRRVFLAHGFTIKDGQTDLKPYVFDAARALLAEATGQEGRAE